MTRFTFLILLFSASFLHAQTNDNIVWASVKVSKDLSPKTTFTAAPILRLNDDISDYQNFSIDLIIKQKLKNGFSAQFLSRTWFWPDQKDWQFLWADVQHGKSFKKWSLFNGLRYHHAIDHEERELPDFLRYKLSVTLLNFGMIKPFLTYEPWLRLNGENEFQRIRYEAGVKFPTGLKSNLLLGYRREENPGFGDNDFNMFLITFGMKI